MDRLSLRRYQTLLGLYLGYHKVLLGYHQAITGHYQAIVTRLSDIIIIGY